MKENKTVKEKIHIFLNEIYEMKQITQINQPIKIPYDEAKKKGLDRNFVDTFLRKLDGELGLIRIVNVGSPFVGFVVDGRPYDGSKHYHIFYLKNGFDEYYNKTINDPDNDKKSIDDIKNRVENFSTQTIENYRVLLNVIKHKLETTIKSSNPEVVCQENYHEDNQINPETTERLTKKLEADFKIIKIINFKKDNNPTGYGNFPLFQIKVIEDKFFDFFQLIEDKFNSQNTKNTSGNQQKEGLRITYSEHTQEIILNNFFLIANPDFDSENDQVFHYLYKNPNKLVNKGEIMQDLNISLTKDFGKILENMNFKKNLRKAFFDVSQDKIKFHNPVSKERLEDLGIKNIPIQIK